MYCPRRTVLDALLVTAAREAGADIRERVTVRHLLWDGQRVSARSSALACHAAGVPGLSAKSLGRRDPAHCTGGGAFGHDGACPDALVLLDETYRCAVYGDDMIVPSVAPMSPNVVVTGSLSKCHGVPGVRIGWVIIRNARPFLE